MSPELVAEAFPLSPYHSTTRLLTRERPIIEEPSNSTFQTVLFLPEGEGRQSEGGLRTRGYFKRRLHDKPLITVITVVFNGATYLEDSIQSVINQTYENVEYIIIDGASTDSTLNVIRKYDNAIDYWVSEKDRGVYDAMNKGISLSACSEFIYFLGCDDQLSNKNVLLNLAKSIKENSRIDLYYGYTVNEKNIKINSRYSSLLLLHNCLHHQATFYKKSLFDNFRYDHSFEISSDFELNLRAFISASKSKHVDLCIASCKDGGISTNKKNYFQHVIETNKIKSKVINNMITVKIVNIAFWLKALLYYAIRYK